MSNPDSPGFLTTATDRLVSLAILAAPAVVLGAVAARSGSGLPAVGTAAVLLGAALFLRYPRVWAPPSGGSVVLLYLLAAGWLWLATHDHPDGLTRAARGLLLLAAVGLGVYHDLLRTGLAARRRATRLCDQLRDRSRWPDQMAAYAELPEVRALQTALRDDPGPALRLLTDPRPEVRLAAYLSLQARPYWRVGEAAAVLTLVEGTIEPPVRAAGVLALATAHDADTVLALCDFLRDPSADVRAAAGEAVLAGGSGRWPLVRDLVRAALTEPKLTADGPLPGSAGRLPPLAICDLTAWASEPEPLAERSIQTLVGHYAVLLRAGDYPDLGFQLGQQVTDPQTPPVLRVELASLLRKAGLIPHDLLDRMTDVDQPGMIRLIGAEAMLSEDPANEDAVNVLKGLGRQSNRETVLAIAQLVQTYLHLDMGMPVEGVAANSKAAAEAARRVFEWATGRSTPPSIPVEAGSAWVSRPVAGPALPPLRPTAPPPRTQSAPDIGSGSIWTPRNQ